MKNEWEKVTLGELMTFKNGLNFTQDLNGMEYNFLGVGSFKSKNAIRDVSELEKIYLSNSFDTEYLLKKNDLVFVRSNGSKELVGRCVLIENEIKNTTYSGFCIKGSLKSEKTTSKYILKIIEAGFLKERLKHENRGTNISNLNQEILNSLEIKLPSIEEQNKIIEILSTWDSAIEKTEKLISEKEKKLQWIIIHYFENAEKNKNWIESKLSEFLKPGDKNPVENTANYRKITIKLHKNGIEYINSQRRMVDTRPFYIRRAGELIIGKQNYFNGSIALLEKDFDGAICSNAIMSFSIAKSINPDFLLEAISTKKYLREKSVYANGTGQKELSENVFLSFDVKLPSLKMQNEIMEIVNLQKSEISLLKKQLEQYKLQKQGLMQKLLTGKWRVK